MPMWRCPHCGTPQPETDRCWVCRRSSTCCATCRHYRRAVAAGLGYCGLDRQRRPLTGHEMRSCWLAAGSGTSVPPDAGSGSRVPPAVPSGRTGVRNRRDFEAVPVVAEARPAGPIAPGAVPTDPAGTAAAGDPGPGGRTGSTVVGAALPGWSLFPELDP
ncbi:MAG TPA: hypothetical protein VLA23_07230 [Candidatus Limnocylindrales bacterium]|nr:hypothetical protein [Candidatus Limnocylindrales bacterium]